MTTVIAADSFTPEPLPWTARGYTVVRLVLGMVVLVAAGLKCHQLATAPTANQGILTNRWFLILEVEGELFFSLCLLSGITKRLVWMLAVVCFSAFAAITLYKALSGEASCGCFGKIHVHPWYTFGFDLTSIIALAVFRPHKSRLKPAFPWARAAVVALVALALGGPGGIAMARYRPARLTVDGDIIGESQSVQLEPETWRGKAFPLIKYIDIGRKLTRGDWIVVLYDSGCGYCREAVPKFEQLAQETAHETDAPQIALIEIPPYSKPEDSPVSVHCPCTLGRLSDCREWFVGTPTVVSILDGQVTHVFERRGKEKDPFTKS